ncbi:MULTISPECIES: maleylacetoacetate isomerase [Halomonadaceae]|uniref:maleylacetoacetate isomerase n=1 Tax=Halomonadaceae TaxID=28256 RepID=UPI0012F28572|nr:MULTISPECIES: maleylacetoacetate isomerase [Halomonas]CAD5261331.1 putative maleylacetoacetate isomerase [Halomonas sp. 59]CAD5261609.1 putative maleylacetoacetate isomerase [Halomonas sp. 113]CAD5275592.1 putative maleylacetoacetate isomerase [Halomonas sp. I3]CAD5287084.1 putative maleylacetoacetate isomerase [Halomonas sp. 156]VXB44899.1 putative maleylacetoacetate isomerase [Halomonas titanicae]
MTTLYGYFRSSAAYRVRIALNLKGLDYDQIPVNLVKGEQRGDDHLMRNPQGLVPSLVLDDSTVVNQSLAICEYLDEVRPEPALLPVNALERAQVRALAQSVACEIHPLNNLRVLKYLVREMGADEAAKLAWYHHWIAEGFTALEATLSNAPSSGDFCHGDTPTLADICLIPQVYNAERFECDLSAYPTIQRIAANCRALPAFEKAAPEVQPDAS